MRKILTLTLLIFFINPHLPEAKNVVDTTKTYTYNQMMTDIEELQKLHPDIIEFKSIGKTKYNRDIIAVKVGKGKSRIIITGSIHAREWITTVLVMKMIEEYSGYYNEKKNVSGIDVNELLNNTSIWFIPMANPDGVTLQQKGLSAFPTEQHNKLLEMNNGSRNFKRWKSNAEGIDLNRQFPANWSSYSDVNIPSWSEYKGANPFQAAETQALKKITYEVNPSIVVSYHSSGEVLYWTNNDKNNSTDTLLARKFSELTGYPTKKHGPYRSYTDWFAQEFSGVGFTPELGEHIKDSHVPLTEFPSIWAKHKNAGLWITTESLQRKHSPDSIWFTKLDSKRIFPQENKRAVPEQGPVELSVTKPSFMDYLKKFKALIIIGIEILIGTLYLIFMKKFLNKRKEEDKTENIH